MLFQKPYDRSATGLALRAIAKIMLAIMSCCFLAAAQDAIAQSSPPLVNAKDSNGVNLADGQFDIPGMNVGIGSSDSGLSFNAEYGNNNYQDYISYPTMSAGGGNYKVYMNVAYNGASYRFSVGYRSFQAPSWNAYTITPGPYFDTKGEARFECPSYPASYHVTGNCTLYLKDGTIVNYVDYPGSGPDGIYSVASSVVKPDGEVITLTYSPGTSNVISVTNSLGWMLKLEGGTFVNKVTAINTSSVYCDPNAATCSVSSAFPYATATYCGGVNSGNCNSSVYNNGILTVSYSGTNGNAIGNPPSCADVANVYTNTITTPSGVSRTANYSFYCAYDQHYKISSATTGGNTWSYTYAPGSNSGTITTKQNPLPDTSTFSVNWWGQVQSRTDELSRTTSYQWATTADGDNATLTKVTTPDGSDTNGGYTSYQYDSDRNILQSTNVPLGSGSNIVSSATYTTPCDSSNYRICHKPLTVTDALGNVTTYTYDINHGGVLTETGPADANGVHPQKRYSYTQLYPKVMNSAGALINSTAVWRLTKISACMTATAADSASCAGTANEIVTTYAYNSNNLFLTSETVAAGDGSYSATTSYGYDNIGNRIWVDGPRTDVDDKSYTTYDVLRRPVYEIGVLPGGSGSPHRTVVHHVYDSDGRESQTETGYASSDATDGSDFVVTSFKRMTYDSTSGLLTKTEVVQP